MVRDRPGGAVDNVRGFFQETGRETEFQAQSGLPGPQFTGPTLLFDALSRNQEASIRRRHTILYRSISRNLARATGRVAGETVQTTSSLAGQMGEVTEAKISARSK